VTDPNWIIDTVPSMRYPVYTRLNANDVMPDPITPLGASLVWIPEVLPAWAVGNVRLRYFTPAEMSPDPYPPVAGFFYGYLYVDQTYVRITGIRAGIGADAIDAAFFAHPNPPRHVPSPTDMNEELAANVAERVGWTLTTTSFPELEEERELAERVRAERPDLHTVSDEMLITLARRAAPLQRIMWGRGYVIASNQAAMGPGIITSLVGAADPTLTVRLIGHAGDVDSALPSFALWDLSRAVRADARLTATFDKGEEGQTEQTLLDRLRADHPEFATRFDLFVREFGYRGPSEWDIGVHTWETKPELPLALIGRLRHLDDDASPGLRREQRADDAAAALQEALKILGPNEEAVQTLHLAIASARRFGAWRERGKTSAVKVIHEVRAPLFELGRRLTARGELDHPQQVFMALEPELDLLATHAADIADTLRERERQWRQLFEIEPPTFVVAGEPMTPVADVPRKGGHQVTPVRPGDVLTGAPASAGVARGRARVVTDTAQIAAFEPGEILVAPQTDPSWTPLFMVAAGVVVDVGAMGSHAMIVSRELGIPCAAGVGDATKRIPDGTLLEVDGSSGKVTVLEG
jgi:phosphohistidine swiveling domain-containing protein